MKLNDLTIGKKGKIKKINLPLPIKNRLLDLGLIEENVITCILISPLEDPKAYKINDTLIALRNKEAKEIEVEKIND